MRVTEPPSIASWILKHLTPGPCNEALVGDLVEQFRCGRSKAWYWHQVLSTIATGCIRAVANHRIVLLYSVVWSMLAPAWFVLSTNAEINYRVIGRIYRLDWPWSTLIALGLSAVTNLTFIWSGVLFYLLPHMWITKSFSVRQLWRRLFLSAAAFIAICAAELALLMFFPIGHGHGIDRRTLTEANSLTDLRTWAILHRLFSLLLVLIALWGVTSNSGKRRNRIVA